MRTCLVTGGAGFIGSNFVRYTLSRYDDVRVVNVDALTYAANPASLDSVRDDPRYEFVHGNICDRALVRRIVDECRPDYVVNFAAESHVDRSIENPAAFVETNVLGTISLLDALRDVWASPRASAASTHRYLQVSTDEVYGSLSLDAPCEKFHPDSPLDPRSPYSASKASADQFVNAYAETLQQLRSLPARGEVHSASGDKPPERGPGQALWGRSQREGLDSRGGPLQCHMGDPHARGGGQDVSRGRGLRALEQGGARRNSPGDGQGA